MCGSMIVMFGLRSNSPSDYIEVFMRVLRIRIGGRLMASDDAGNQKPNATHPLQVPLSLETYMREPVNIHNTEATARTAKRIENLAGVASQQVTTAAMGCIGPDVMPIDDRTDRAGRRYKFSSERRVLFVSLSLTLAHDECSLRMLLISVRRL